MNNRFPTGARRLAILINNGATPTSVRLTLVGSGPLRAAALLTGAALETSSGDQTLVASLKLSACRADAESLECHSERSEESRVSYSRCFAALSMTGANGRCISPVAAWHGAVVLVEPVVQ